MKLRASAKVNLCLRVGARAPDGFHAIETLFCLIDLADDIELEFGGDGVRLAGSGAALGPAESNLAVRAASAFYDAIGESTGVRIVLEKRIPIGAGLGGGSSDAGAVLRALNQAHGEPLDAQRLLDIAAGLGSDVPFFASGAALSIGRGRGERLTTLAPLAARPVVVVAPDFPIATADAYAMLEAWRAEHRSDVTPARIPAVSGWDDVRALAENHFEAPLFARYPVLAAWRHALSQRGARVALLSGSGSALFGVFEDGSAAEAAATALRATGGATVHRVASVESPGRLV